MIRPENSGRSPGQCAGDNEIAFCCGNERSIGGELHDLERALDPVVPRAYGQFLPHPLSGDV